MSAFTHECCYMCHGCGSVARDMYGPGSTVIEHDEPCQYCNGKGTVVVERPSQPTPAQLPQGRADEPAAHIQQQWEQAERAAKYRDESDPAGAAYRARIAELEKALRNLCDSAAVMPAKSKAGLDAYDAARAALKGSK